MIKKFTSINEVNETINNENFNTKITIIGVGGAGTNAVNNMIEMGLKDIKFIVVNTDAQSVEKSNAPNKIQIGPKVSKGLGAGSRPEIGIQAAEESKDLIVEALQDTNMLFITCGMGGGTGTGASQVIAKLAQDMGILTLAFVTKPFDFEGPQKSDIALLGIVELEKLVDSLVIISNQNLFEITSAETSFVNAFKETDNILYSGVKAITDLIISNGIVNLDFNDIKSVIEGMGRTMIASEEAEGEQRVQEIIKKIIYNPLLENKSLKGAEKILINISGGDDMTLFEVNDIINHIKSEVSENCFINFGTIYNQESNNKIRVSVVATGLSQKDFQINQRKSAKSDFKTTRQEEKELIESLKVEEEPLIQEQDNNSINDNFFYEEEGENIIKQEEEHTVNQEEEVLIENPSEDIKRVEPVENNSDESFSQDADLLENTENYFEDNSSDNLFDLITKKNKYQNSKELEEKISSESLIQNRNNIAPVAQKEEYKEDSFFDLPKFLKKNK